jgi:hypothetical protein
VIFFAGLTGDLCAGINGELLCGTMGYFRRNIYPNFEIAWIELDSWAKEYKLYESDWESGLVKAQKLNKFASRLYPNASLIELLPISKLILVLFLADDRADRLHGPERVHFWKNYLLDFENGTSEKNPFCWETLLSDFPTSPWKQNLASLALARKNIRNMVRNFIFAGIWEAENLLKNKPPLPENYLKKLKYSSGAEIAIHYLTPYMQVVLIGDRTFGKPVGSFPLSGFNRVLKDNNVELVPITFATANSAGKAEFFDGFQANFTVGDSPQFGWGDPQDLRLAAALQFVKNGTVSGRMADTYFKPKWEMIDAFKGLQQEFPVY